MFILLPRRYEFYLLKFWPALKIHAVFSSFGQLYKNDKSVSHKGRLIMMPQKLRLFFNLLK